MKRMLPLLYLTAALPALAGCAHTPPDDPADPLEKANRVVYTFNDKVDHYVLRPVAVGYVIVTPSPIRVGISNFFSNLFYPVTIANDVLQAKIGQGVSDTVRFAINTTVGIVGLIDVATPMGIVEHKEDLGQTFGRWGLGQGWYLVLPLLGPSSNRDFVGSFGDSFVNPLSYADNNVRWAGLILHNINKRSQLLETDKLLEDTLDPYLFVRSAYLQRRQSLVYDGHPPPEKDAPVPEPEPQPAAPEPRSSLDPETDQVLNDELEAELAKGGTGS